MELTFKIEYNQRVRDLQNKIKFQEDTLKRIKSKSYLSSLGESSENKKFYERTDNQRIFCQGKRGY